MQFTIFSKEQVQVFSSKIASQRGQRSNKSLLFVRYISIYFYISHFTKLHLNFDPPLIYNFVMRNSFFSLGKDINLFWYLSLWVCLLFYLELEFIFHFQVLYINTTASNQHARHEDKNNINLLTLITQNCDLFLETVTVAGAC